MDGTDSLCCRASVDGLFKGMVGKSDAENHPIMAAMIQTDEQFALPDREEPAEFDAGRYPPEDILAAARQAGIIDEMDGRPLIDKLMEVRALGRLLVGDAVDDEPYLSSALGLLYARPLEVERGMALALHATGDGPGCYLIDATGTDREVGRIRMEKGRKVYRMRGTYPSRSRMAARMRPIGESVFIGVAALLHLYRAVVYGDPHTTCFLTVAGDCIRFPANIEVPVGTLVEDILWFCGVGSKIDTLVVGGSMRRADGGGRHPGAGRLYQPGGAGLRPPEGGAFCLYRLRPLCRCLPGGAGARADLPQDLPGGQRGAGGARAGALHRLRRLWVYLSRQGGSGTLYYAGKKPLHPRKKSGRRRKGCGFRCRSGRRRRTLGRKARRWACRAISS